MLKKMSIKLFNVVLILIAVVIIVAALLLNAARVFVPLLDKKQAYFERWASHVIRQPVTIGNIQGTWHGFEPVLTFNNVKIRRHLNKGTVIKIRQLSIGIDVLDSLLKWKLLPGSLSIIGTHLDIIQEQSGRFIVRGVASTRHKRPVGAKPTEFKHMLLWLLTQANVTLNHININFYSKSGVVLPVKNVRLKVTNDALHHTLAGVADLSQTVPTRFKFIISIGNYDLDAFKFDANIYLEAHQVSLSQLFALSPFKQYQKGIQITNGTANIKAWMRWQGRKPQSLHTQLTLNHVGVYAPHYRFTQSKHMLLSYAAANLQWLQLQRGWSLKADHLQLRANGEYWQESQLGLRVLHDKKNKTSHYLIKAGFLRLQDLRQLAEGLHYIPAPLKKLYADYQPQGELQHIALELNQNKQIFSLVSLHSQFSDLQWSAYHKVPGVTHLSGRVFYTPKGGKLSLQGKHTTITAPKVFTHALQLQQLSTQLSWQRQPNQAQIKLSQFSIVNKDLDIQGQAAINKPKNAKATLDLLAGFTIKNSNVIERYVPTKVLKAPLAHWLTHAFLGGQLTDGTVLYRGLLKDFPFNKRPLSKQEQKEKRERGGDTFEVNATLKNLSLKFHDEWPSIDRIDGRLNFTNRAMTLIVDHADMMGNRLAHLKAHIPNLKHAVLTLTAQSTIELKQGWALLKATPLHFVKSMKHAEMSGPATVKLKVVAKLHGPHTKVHTKGSVLVNNGIVNFSDWKVKLSKVKGLLRFNDGKLTAKGIKARYLDSPIHISVNTVVHKPKGDVIQVTMGGGLTMSAVQKNFDIPYLKYMTGTTQFRGLLDIPSDSKLGVSLSVMTDLYGVTMHDLPTPYLKPPTVRKMFNVQLDSKDRKLFVRVNYDKRLSIAAVMHTTPTGSKLMSADIYLGKGKAQYQTIPGLVINGRLSLVNWADWHAFIRSMMPHKNGPTPDKQTDLPLRYIEFQIGALHIRDHQFKDIYFKLTPRKRDWAFNVQNSLVAGILYVPYNKDGIWSGHFQHLIIPKSKKGSKDITINPNSIPRMNLSVGRLIYAGKKLGQVTLYLAPRRHGVSINRIIIRNRDVGISMSGYWTQVKDQSQTYLRGMINSDNLGAFLRTLDTTNRLDGGKGIVTFAANWPGSPLKMKLAGLDGDVKFNVRDGRIVHLGKSTETELGLGRLLNLLSLQSLPQRLTLNFDDFTKKGFKFDSFQGDFRLNDGVASTRGAVMRGPIARIALKGNIGFAKQTFDLYMQVSPNVTSSLPLIAGIAGGPIAGAVTWVASKIFGPIIARAVGSTYKITGSWDKPKFVKIKKHEDRHFVPVDEKR